MSGEILSVLPSELKFPFELRKQVSTSLRLFNVTSEYVAFKVKTTSPKKYCVRPNTGLVPPQGSTDVVVTMQAQKEAPPDMQCKDKFLVQSVLVPGGTSREASQDFFVKENGREVHEIKLRVVYMAPPQPPSPVAESAEEGFTAPSPFPPTAKALGPSESTAKDVVDFRAKLAETKSALAQATEERNSVVRELQRIKVELGGRLQQPQQSRSAQQKRQKKGYSFFFLVLVALIFYGFGFYAAQPRIGAGEAL